MIQQFYYQAYIKIIEMRTKRNTNMSMFITALFAIGRKNLSVHQQIVIYNIHTMKYYSVTERNEVLKHTTAWMNLEL